MPAPRVGPPPPLDAGAIEALVRPALAEDVAGGDRTAQHAVPAAARAVATLVAKREGVAAGLAVFARVFEVADPSAQVELLARDGAAIRRGDVLARVTGSARALLSAERTALNFVQRLSGIATLTARYVALATAAGMRPPRILDTRKTTPLLRVLEKHAVRCGGGENHRFSLHDEVMVKENHIELSGRPIEAVLADLRRAVGPGVRITSEARDEREALAGVDGGADVVLLDNMTPAQMATLVPVLRARAATRGRPLELEASGGIDEHTLGDVVRSGVDRISVGALTHSAPALDLSLDLAPAAR
ncbi:MAG: carboxylating nicotinate-nucleotide diphosphorylase [Planctomycetes bacterium]|nr:carboxylating nicotinate-nucleotide diphosphorylase [Planctomycetota bacterium]